MSGSGLDRRALDRAVTFAAANGTAQLVIADSNGPLVDETYHAAPVDVYAVQKGLLAVLLMIAEERLLLDLPDPVNHHLDPAWTGLSPWDEAKLTVEILLQMTTGMDDELAPLGVIGETWRYNNTAYNYLKPILELHTGLTLDALTRAWLLEPLGMTATRWVDRPLRLPDGRAVTGLLSTAGDLAQFGMMLLQGGGGLVSPQQIERLSQPGSTENPAWGLCWWNNNQTSFRLPMREDRRYDGPLTPAAPEDMISARGAMENYLYVAPSMDLVIARTAAPLEAGARPVRFDKPFWQLLTGS